MSKFALNITTVNGTEYYMFGDADTPDHAQALRLRDNWRQWKASMPGAVFALAAPNGRVDVPCGDMAGVRVDVGSGEDNRR